MAWEPATNLAKAVVAAGFRYEPAQDIITSKLDAWQRKAGFCWKYDQASAALRMIIDAEPIYFSYGGRMWMIELWKGQYGLETGCEIGVYVDDLAATHSSRDAANRFYSCVTPREQLTMSSWLYSKKDGAEVFHRGPESHFWLTGFKWGVFTPKTSDLKMKVEIQFDMQHPLIDPVLHATSHDWNVGMREAFRQALHAKGYTNIWYVGRCGIGFWFDAPFTTQPASRTNSESRIQAGNELLVAGYNLYKRAHNIRTNDPNNFTAHDIQWQKVGDAISAAAKKIGGEAPAAARKLLGASPLAHKIQHHVEAAAKKLESLPDEARTAYHHLFTFFESKAWKCRPGHTG